MRASGQKVLIATADAIVFSATLAHPAYGALALWACAGIMRRLQISQR